jgi:tetratricopeptide (TPR) repeat protein
MQFMPQIIQYNTIYRLSIRHNTLIANMKHVNGTALKKSDKNSPSDEVKGDTAKAESLTKQAEELMAKGNYDQAVGLLEQARSADSNYGRAAFMMGRAYRLCKKFPEATKAYRSAAGLMSDNTEVLNELAAMLETQGKKIQALAVYRQSLRVNWNQPPVMEALSRLNIKYAGSK